MKTNKNESEQTERPIEKFNRGLIERDRSPIASISQAMDAFVLFNRIVILSEKVC